MTNAEDRSDAEVLVYWRPGCGFCAQLERGIRANSIDATFHNIWEDPAHAAVVRSVANGNETVPTVIVGDLALVNPSADAVVAALASVRDTPATN